METTVNKSGQSAGISGYWLKMIAVVTMFIDHLAATILGPMIRTLPSWGPVTMDNWEVWSRIYLLLRGIGRMAFPIYCFLLVEGFTYTRSRTKYAVRMFIFALISEVPFDMALNKNLVDFSHNNVFFTLLIGLLTITATDWAVVHMADEGSQRMNPTLLRMIRTVVIMAILLAGCMLAGPVMHSDYGAGGVIAIYILYMFRKQRMMGFGLAVFALGMLVGSIELLALLMLIPMYLYNGTRGRQHKYFFYAFYPVHLLILALICQVIGLGI